MSDARKIVDATIALIDLLGPGGLATVKVELDDGQKLDAFTYYTDELSFEESELVGLTLTEARELHFSRDMEYLRS